MALDLKNRLAALIVTDAIVADALQVFGLRWELTANLDYMIADEALAAKTLEIMEVDEGGHVPTLLVVNRGERMVLLVAGEQLVGAKQNRVLNASIMVPVRTRLPVPVSCVEAGRWGYRSRKFSSSGSSSHGYLRKMMSKGALRGYRAHKSPTSDQGAVWAEVDRKMHRLGSSSASAALLQVYEDYHARLVEINRQVRVPEGCHGVVFAFGGRIAGADLFDRPESLARLLPKLVQAYAIDALEEPAGAPVERSAVVDWLQTAATARYEPFQSPGVGTDIRIEAEKLVGASLVVSECPVHTELFPEEARPAPSEGPQPDLARQTSPAAGAGSSPADIVVLPTSPELFDATRTGADALRGVFAGGLEVSPLMVEEERRSDRAGRTSVLNHQEETRLVALARTRAPAAKLRVIVTRSGLADNWFSHWHEDARTTVVSLCDWAQLSPVPPAAFIANALLLHSLYLFQGCDPRQLLHGATRGCLFDLCVDKQDISRKLRAGDICPVCRAALVEMGVPVDPVLRQLERVRRLACA